MNILNNKKVIIIAALLLGMAVLLISFYGGSSSAKKDSKNYKNIAIKNSLAKDADFKKETTDKDAEANVNRSVSLIKEFLFFKATLIGYDTSATDNDFKEISSQLSKKDYKKPLETIKKDIDKLNAAIESYKAKDQEELKKIGDLLLKKYAPDTNAIIANQKIIGDWATVTITLPSGYAFAAKAILKKENGEWQTMLPPSSMFDKKALAKLKSMNAPKEVTEDMNTNYSKDVLTPVKY